jgi:hypothetical protein
VVTAARENDAEQIRATSQFAGLWVVTAPMRVPVTPDGANMIASEVRAQVKAKRTLPTSKAGKPKSSRKSSPPRAMTAADDVLQQAQMTKHDRVLTLLSRREGATVQEIMEATNWQQHSVRGFFAGTVKKKLGFTLTSKKSDGELRRYRIEAKRGR